MSKQTSTTKKVAEGLGVMALAAGAAAAYYLTGKEGQKNRKNISAWAKKAKLEIAQKTKGMEKFSKAAYEQASKEVMAKYKQAKNIDPKELAAFGQEMKGHWDQISKHINKLGAKKAPVSAKKKAKK